MIEISLQWFGYYIDDDDVVVIVIIFNSKEAVYI